MDRVGLNNVSHPSSHGPSSDIGKVPWPASISYLLGFAPHLLMCYAPNMWNVLHAKICEMLNSSNRLVCYAPNQNLSMCCTLDPYLQMYYAPDLDLEMCYATKLIYLNLLIRTTISYK